MDHHHKLCWYDGFKNWGAWFWLVSVYAVDCSLLIMLLTDVQSHSVFVLMINSGGGHISVSWYQDKVHMVAQWPDDLISMCILRGFMNVCLASCCSHILPLKQQSYGAVAQPKAALDDIVYVARYAFVWFLFFIFLLADHTDCLKWSRNNTKIKMIFCLFCLTNGPKLAMWFIVRFGIITIYNEDDNYFLFQNSVSLLVSRHLIQ